MKTSYILIISIIALLIVSYQSAECQWVQTEGPTGGDVRSLAVMGKTLFAGTNGGVYSSTDMGVRWNKSISSANNVHEVNTLAVLDTYIFAGTQFNGIFRSSDNGVSWIRVYYKWESISSLVVSGTNIIAGSKGYGLHISTDSGASWKDTGVGLLDKATINCFAVSGSNVFVSTDLGVFNSTDDGVSWASFDSGLNGYRYSIFATGLDLYASTGDSLFLSTNLGKNWININSGISALYVSALIAYGETVYTTGYGGTYVTTNKGSRWRKVETGLFNKYVNTITVIDSNLFVGTFYGGVYTTTINDENWKVSNNGLTSTRINCLTSSGPNLYAGTERTGMAHSSSNGTNWTTHYYGSAISEIYEIAAEGSNLYLGTSNGEVIRTTDNGISWKNLPYGVNTGSIVSFAVSDSIIIANNNLSKDYGTHWMKIKIGTSAVYNHDYAISGNSIYAATDQGVFLSSDLGITWSSISEGLPKEGIKRIVISGSKLFCGTNSNGVYYSSDNGMNWKSVSKDNPKKHVDDLAVLGSNVIAVMGSSVYLLLNIGSNWELINQGMKDQLASRITISGGNLYVGTYFGGVWKRPLSDVVTSVDFPSNDIRRESPLLHCYPNPAKEECIVEYTITKPGVVTLEFFDAMSNRVSIPVNTYMQAGSYNTMLNTSSLANGVYYYRFQSSDGTETKKLSVIR